MILFFHQGYESQDRAVVRRGYLTQRSLSPDAGLGADAEREGIQGVKGEMD